MKKIFLFLLLTSIMHSAYAVKVLSIYTGEAPVATQNEEQRDLAIQQAFSQTLVKVSGNSAILQNPTIKDALPKAKNYVQEFGYSRLAQGAVPFQLKVEFDPKAIQKLLSAAKAPVWDVNRPLILIWLIMDNPGHTPELVDNGSTNEFAVLLNLRSKYRGVPLLFPTMDVADLSLASPADVQAMLPMPLQKASERYHADGVLLGNIRFNGKKPESHWKLVIGQDQWEWGIDSDSVPVMVESLIDKMAGVLGNRYAAVSTENESSSLVVTVKGVSEQDDLDSLLRFLRHMSMIKELKIENVSGDEVILNLAVQGAKQAFMQDVSVGQHLQLQLDKENNLTYLWMR